MDMGIPLLNIQILLDSSPLKSRILVRRFAVQAVVAGAIVTEAFLLD